MPFRHPLLALAQAPGSAPGDPSSEALAVGLDGQVGRFVPGEGWRPEGLYNAAGEAQTPVLRGVAWPEPERAFAVGDNGAMWVRRADTGLWEPDPAKPYNFIGNLTAIAFAPSEPSLGFAVGKEGALLRYGKSWEEITQQAVKHEAKRLEGELGTEEWRLNFTSLAFAGGEALATYRVVRGEGGGAFEAGGLLVYGEAPPCAGEDEQIERELHSAIPADERACWHTNASAASVLAGLPDPRDTVLSKVAGLPDGGAVAAGPDVVIERQSEGGSWALSPVPLPEAHNISALAAYREGGSGPVRAIASIDLDVHLDPNLGGVLQRAPFGGDVPVTGGPGQPPPFIPPDPLPNSGYVVEQTADGWRDIEHMALPATAEQRDLPERPDPVFALLVDQSGGQGLAVGGQTYDMGGEGSEQKGETAGAQRFPAASSQGQATPSALAAPPGEASIVVGGDASCAQPCADLANEGIGDDVWLTHVLQTASHIGGDRAFVYLGSRSSGEVSEEVTRESERFEELLGAAGSLPVYVEPVTFGRALALGGGPAPVPCTQAAHPCQSGTDAYELTSTGSSGGPVRLIVLDYVKGELGAAQREWLTEQLALAAAQSEPAIVFGRDALDFNLPDQIDAVAGQTTAAEAAAVSQILVQGRASAYVFDYPAVNVHTQVASGRESIPAYGTGTIGPEDAYTGNTADSLQSSAFLALDVDTATREARGTWPVTAAAIPDVGQLSLNATNGVLLRRSHVALFEGLARRPLAGIEVGAGNNTEGRLIDPNSYDPIPTNCQGPNCGYEVPLEYTFTSSNPDIGGFVEHEASSAEGKKVQLNAQHKPIPDEPRNSQGELLAGDHFAQNHKGEPINEQGEVVSPERSALFCPYNEGTTTITITTGGLSYSMPVTVQGGSVEYPCGTVPLKHPAPRIQPASPSLAIPALAPASPASPGPTPQLLSTPAPPPLRPPLPPPPPVPHPAVHPAPHHTAPAPVFPFLPAAAGLALLRPLIVPPPLSPVQPTPPSGTSSVQVYQNAVAPEREREEEAATDLVHNMAAYTPASPPGPAAPYYYLPAVVALLAFAGAALYDVRRWQRPGTARVRDEAQGG
ncbi:MAG: hypothetical protein FWD42_00015 [Solirubrobacterales bacterium]|nr:hypothetical protein [Solirubrobacterales bacterium]